MFVAVRMVGCDMVGEVVGGDEFVVCESAAVSTA